jgi:3-isopropylmalate/(R)-2-methylmalate dehydratase small subunit
MEPFTRLTSRVVPLLWDDVDTDQIIPARFLKTTSRRGLGEHLFADRRGIDLDPEARVLLAGVNFGCGSSREHAAWALLEHGFRAVVARSFADIFEGNALENGLLPVKLEARHHARLAALLEQDPRGEVSIDLEAQAIVLPDGSEARFPVNPFSKCCLLSGTDELDYLLSVADRVADYESERRR